MHMHVVRPLPSSSASSVFGHSAVQGSERGIPAGIGNALLCRVAGRLLREAVTHWGADGEGSHETHSPWP